MCVYSFLHDQLGAPVSLSLSLSRLITLTYDDLSQSSDKGQQLRRWERLFLKCVPRHEGLGTAVCLNHINQPE